MNTLKRIQDFCKSRYPEILFGLSFLLYLLTLFPGTFDRGDGACYAEQIRNGDFLEIPKHFGYFIVAIVLARLFWFIPNDLFANLISAIFGSLSVYLVPKISFEFKKNHFISVLSGILLATSKLFWINSLVTEIYTLQVFLILLCIWVIIKGKEILLAPLFGFSLLVTYPNILCLPFLLLLLYKTNRLKLSREIIYSLIITAAFMTPLLFFIGGALYEHMMVNLGRSTLKTEGVLSIQIGTLSFLFHCYNSFFLGLPFLVIGLIYELKNKTGLSSYLIALFVPHFIVFGIAKDFVEGGAFYLPLHPFFAIFAGIGIFIAYEFLQVTLSKTHISVNIKYVKLAFLCTLMLVPAISVHRHLFGSDKQLIESIIQRPVSYLPGILDIRRDANNFRDFCYELDKLLGEDGIVFMDWSSMALYGYYTHGTCYTPTAIDFRNVNYTQAITLVKTASIAFANEEAREYLKRIGLEQEFTFIPKIISDYEIYQIIITA